MPEPCSAHRVFFLFAWTSKCNAGRVRCTRHHPVHPSHTAHEETSQPATTALQSMGVVCSKTRPTPGCQGWS
ncbi:hypothetical protein QBC39DRAFT_363446 [Podospora conica]|nr:hypothetical protein QBC39DRAFT_363446 [Schizothecium conicum]